VPEAADDVVVRAGWRVAVAGGTAAVVVAAVVEVAMAGSSGRGG
jgi:hypothetical protein